MANGSDSINTHGGMPYLFQKTKEQWLAEGDAHYQVKRYEEALEAYVNVLLIDPNAAAVYNRKGFALLKLRRNEEAFDAFFKARDAFEFDIHLHPTDAETLGPAERAIQLAPTDAEAYSVKAHALRKLKCYTDALGVYERLLALNPNLEQAWMNKAEVLKHLGRSKEAQQAYETVRRLAKRRWIGW